jgi:cyclase
MLKKRIIACLDIKNGRVVKGINFVKIRDAGDPIKLAKIYSLNGADEICFLDIEASHKKKNILFKLVTETAKSCLIPLTVGGGVRSIDDIKNLLLAGADKVSINTAAVLDHSFIKKSSKRFGSQCIVIAIDVKKASKNTWEVFTHGGRKKTGIDAIEYAKKAESLGAGEILLTSMDKDGTRAGYDLELTKKISTSISIPVIASGGVGNLEHLVKGFSIGCASAVLAASIFHYGDFSITDAKKYLSKRGIPIRL